MDCVLVTTPLQPGIHLTAADTSLLPAPNIYRRLVGRFLYLNLTWPDIFYAVQKFSQFMAKPAMSHLTTTLHVVKYLKGSPSLGLFYYDDSHFLVKAYTDADWGSCSDSWHSLTGFFVFLGSSLVSWRCKKQTTISASSAEAEYRALGSTVRELQWLSYLLQDFHITVPLLIPSYCDNMAALHITKNLVFHEQTKHLEIDCHIVRNLFLRGFVLPSHISTTSKLADLFTKALFAASARSFQSKMSLVDVYGYHLEGVYRICNSRSKKWGYCRKARC